jgi:hypothetical protein
VIDLVPTDPCAGLDLPVTTPDARLAGMGALVLTSVAPFKGADVSPWLGAFPAPGEIRETPAGRLAWAGLGAAFLFAPPPEGLADLAAVTDQSDGWAGLRLEGPGAVDVLARLVAVDMRHAPAATRCQLGHMSALILRAGPWAFEIFVFRSMARTAVHELTHAMRGVAARAGLG